MVADNLNGSEAMSKDMNSVQITGRLGRDPEVRYSQGGEPICSLSVAVSGTKKAGDQWVDDATWVAVTVFGKQAESCGQFLAKGSRVAVAGRLVLEQWQDKKTDEKREKLKVVASDVVFLTPRSESDPSKPSSSKTSPATSADQGFADDNLPF